MTNINRTLVITRKSAFVGCALKFTVYLDGEAVGTVANGTTLKIPMSSDSHALRLKPLFPGIKAPTLKIGAGFADVSTRLQCKNAFGLTPEWTLTVEEAQQNREMTRDTLCALLLLLSSKSDDRSLYPKMEEFRQAGLDLQVNFTVRAEDVLVAPQELIEDRSVGESFTMNYREWTSEGSGAIIHSLSAGEQLDLAAQFEQWIGMSDDHSHLIVSRFGTTVSIRLKP